MKIVYCLFFVSTVCGIPQRKKINVNRYVDEALSTPVRKDRRITASTNLNSPSTAAALAYMNSVSKDEICGLPSKAYVQTIFSGKTKEQATAEAAKIYVKAYNSGESFPQKGACASAGVAYKEAYRKGDDPILQAALAYINAWPGAKDGNPCAMSGIAFMKAIVAGKTQLEAGNISMKEFAKAFKKLAKQGRPLKDVACRDATKAFIDAIPDKQDPARAAAFTAFMEKIFDDNAPAFDPICLSALEGFIDSYSSGDDLQTANLKAARSFFDSFSKGSSIPADSPCAAATLAYAKDTQEIPSASNAAAMIAYITEAIKNGNRKFDPVCAAATEAYFDAYIEKKSEAAANEAAAIAYIETLDKNPNFDVGSPCALAAQRYIKDI